MIISLQKYILWFFALLFLWMHASAVTIGPSVDDSLYFQTEAERQVFEHYFTGETDYFPLFYVATDEDNLPRIKSIEKAYLKKIDKYKHSPYSGMKPKKLSKIIYNDLHDQYLKKYEYSSLYSEIFQGGSYNCVTASALFAICFEELGFEYEIKILPQHVYILLFPKSEAIRVETTNPLQGFFVPDSRMKKQYVLFLKDQKLISETDYNTHSTEELFQENYYSEESIDIENLVGVHYYNNGIEYFMKENYQHAFYNMEKALLFYPDKRVEFLAKASLQNLLVLGGMKSLEDAKLLTKYPKYASSDLERKLVVEFFKLYTNEVLIEAGDTAVYNQGFRYLESNFQVPELLEEMRYIYLAETGRHYYRTGKTTEAQRYFEKAFEMEPENIDAQSALIEILGHQLTYRPVKEIFQIASGYYDKYEHLRKNNAFVALLASIALTGASQSFRLESAADGKQYLNEFERVFKEGVEVHNYLISDTYISVAVYYFGKGNKAMARAYIDKGLRFSPDNYQLLQLKNSF